MQKMTIEERREKARIGMRKWRQLHREQNRKYMRELMRRLRAADPQRYREYQRLLMRIRRAKQKLKELQAKPKGESPNAQL